MSKKNIPNSFDDSKLPKGRISVERSLEIDRLMESRLDEIKNKLKQTAIKIENESNAK